MPPPQRTAYFSKSRQPGNVFRVSRITAFVPAIASTNRRVCVATPERCIKKFNAVRSPTNSDRILISCALGLFEKQKIVRPVRLVGFGVSDFGGERAGHGDQAFLFAEMDPDRRAKRDEKLDQAVDRLREQFGEASVQRAIRLAPAKKKGDEKGR